MSESRDHTCPRCGAYLPTVTVSVPVWQEVYTNEGVTRVFVGYEDEDDVAECFRCKGAC